MVGCRGFVRVLGGLMGSGFGCWLWFLSGPLEKDFVLEVRWELVNVFCDTKIGQ